MQEWSSTHLHARLKYTIHADERRVNTQRDRISVGLHKQIDSPNVEDRRISCACGGGKKALVLVARRV